MRRTIGCAVVAVCVLVPAARAVAAVPSVIRTGGPSAPDDAKVAIVGTDSNLASKPYMVLGTGGALVSTGVLHPAPGKSVPWAHAYAAPLTGAEAAGSYRVVVPALGEVSRPWIVRAGGSGDAIATILEFFAWNADGRASPFHQPSHLNDATVNGGRHGGHRFNLIGGWMDAGDMIHFAQTTAYAAAVLEAAARIDPAQRASLDATAGVGVRWLRKAHPRPRLFIAQVGDQRDHNHGFRDPASDDNSGIPGIAHRKAYPGIASGGVGGDIAGKAATALALAYDRTGHKADLRQAKEWYAAGKRAGRPTPPLPGGFYRDRHWKDAMAAGAAALYRSTRKHSYLHAAMRFLHSRQSRPDGTLGVVDSFASFAAADICGALGAPPLGTGGDGRFACRRLHQFGAIATEQARDNAFGMPGFWTWGTTAQNGASGALAGLAGCAAGLDGGRAVAAGARDYLLGRNQFGRSFVVGYGPDPPVNPHHWASVFGPSLPTGAVVGGPAPIDQIRGQGFHVGGPFNSSFASYEDRRADYVTSEPALDYAAASVLLLATLQGGCAS
jgi:endoglucanase